MQAFRLHSFLRMTGMALFCMFASAPAFAQDRLKIAVGQRGVWENSISELGQVDIGWTAPPLALDALESNRIRIIAQGDEIPEFRNQPVRVILANAGSLEKNHDAMVRYMAAYRETIEWLWSSPDAIKAYAKWAGVTDAIALRTRDEFVQKDRANPDKMDGIADMNEDAVKLKFIPAPLTKEQLSTLVQLQPAVK